MSRRQQGCRAAPGDRLRAEQCINRWPRDAQRLSDVAEDGTQCADPQRTVTRNRDVMLALLHGGQA